ncbi:DEAD/DEAH box helicase [Nitratidesulfovibrio sp. SRB-5]|uniref:DEAD/DEAH box helicase n=1 Tax=Nitratidesulfovibrio sp. SRB-5 TaxID=2872636 RepID=UPI001CBCDCA0|nr:DEAD/DEAH box helicase [Nitratidesulfovibrio sp. SRB-5]MBZ2171232.1 DEAD/DEAH box helicase [Nitratidesulfovibrio sp. SRB-5]
MTFAELPLDARLLAGVESMGYHLPTPVQRRAIPAALSGRDVLALAATGTGKTAAYALPLLQRLLEGPRGQVRALVVAPTRELAEQIHDHIRRLGSMTRLRSTTIYGGVGIMPQTLRLRTGVEIVVACPGRLLDHLRRGHLNLSALDVLVLDEGDSLFELGFLADVRTLLAAVPARCQRMLFSATLPQAVQGLAGEALRDPVTVSVDAQAPAATVDHALYPVPAHLKTPLLKAMLRARLLPGVAAHAGTAHEPGMPGMPDMPDMPDMADMPDDIGGGIDDEGDDGFDTDEGGAFAGDTAGGHPPLHFVEDEPLAGAVLVFVRTRHGARRLWQQLASTGLRVGCLQGKLSQRRRQATLDGFRTGRYAVLVATDVAARGLDISRVTHVVNYDVPATADAYIHRIGRTGRAARAGTAMTLVAPGDETAVRHIERALGGPVTRCRFEGFDYGATARSPEGARPALPPRQARLPGGRKPQLQPAEAPEPPRQPVRPRPARHAVPPAAQGGAPQPQGQQAAKSARPQPGPGTSGHAGQDGRAKAGRDGMGREGGGRGPSGGSGSHSAG